MCVYNVCIHACEGIEKIRRRGKLKSSLYVERFNIWPLTVTRTPRIKKKNIYKINKKKKKLRGGKRKQRTRPVKSKRSTSVYIIYVCVCAGRPSTRIGFSYVPVFFLGLFSLLFSFVLLLLFQTSLRRANASLLPHAVREIPYGRVVPRLVRHTAACLSANWLLFTRKSRFVRRLYYGPRPRVSGFK